MEVMRDASADDANRLFAERGAARQKSFCSAAGAETVGAHCLVKASAADPPFGPSHPMLTGLASAS